METKKSEALLDQEKKLADPAPAKLSDAVAKEYEIAPGAVRVFVDTLNGGRTIDLNTLTLDQAAHYAERGILTKKKGAKPVKEEDSK